MDDSAEGAVVVTRSDNVGTITLNRPDSLNAFDAAQRATLRQAVLDLDADPEIGVIIVTGAGRGFSAGADLREQAGSDQLPSDRLLREYAPFLAAIAEANKPVISAVNGVAAGIGGALAVTCDLVVMAESASIYLAFSGIGLVPDGGMTWHLERQLGKRLAFEIMALGKSISAQDCLRWGLANEVVADDAVLDAANNLAARLLERAPLSLRYSKAALRTASQSTLPETIVAEAGFQDLAAASEDFAEGRQAFLEKRKPVWRGR